MTGLVVFAPLLVLALTALQRSRRLAARASHEVRGPLTVALLVLESMLARDEVAPEAARGLELQLRRAWLGLDDLAAAPRGGRVPDRLEPVPVAGLLAQVALAWRPVAAARGLELRVSPPSGADGGGAVLADRARLAQALGNLLSNAFEHGTGPVELRARRLGPRLRLEVRDGGPGLDAPIRALARRARAGHGHGLAIAASIAERHGGRLLAAPSAGGARVALELPLGAWAAPPAEEVRE